MAHVSETHWFIELDIGPMNECIDLIGNDVFYYTIYLYTIESNLIFAQEIESNSLHVDDEFHPYFYRQVFYSSNKNDKNRNMGWN